MLILNFFKTTYKHTNDQKFIKKGGKNLAINIKH